MGIGMEHTGCFKGSGNTSPELGGRCMRVLLFLFKM